MKYETLKSKRKRDVPHLQTVAPIQEYFIPQTIFFSN